MIKKEEAREKRRRRIRKRVSGSQERPRLAIFRSATHIYAQVVDDVQGRTLAAASTVGSSAVGKEEGAKELSKVEAAKVVGKTIAEVCQQRGIQRVVFDRGGYVYHGRVKAVADAARAAGLEF